MWSLPRRNEFFKESIFTCQIHVLMLDLFEFIRFFKAKREVFLVARICDVCNKALAFGRNVSHSNRKTNRTWAPNIKRVRSIVDGTPKTINVCTRCIRSGKVKRAL